MSKRSMARFLAFLGCLTLSTVLLSGCGKKDDAADTTDSTKSGTMKGAKDDAKGGAMKGTSDTK